MSIGFKVFDLNSDFKKKSKVEYSFKWQPSINDCKAYYCICDKIAKILFQAKKFVESAPQVVKADIPKDEAEKLKEALAAVGGEVEIE